ncbi:MAG: hypothetical protein V3V29_01780 [Acidimicrobiia bacterium]
MRRLLLAVTGLAIVAAACGGSSGPALSDSEQAVADAAADLLMADPDPDNPFADRASALCFTEQVIGELGVARLAEIGITATDIDGGDFGLLEPGEMESIADFALDCVDISVIFTAAFEEVGVGGDSIDCLVEEMEQTGLLRAAFVAGMAGDDSLDPDNNPETMEQMLTIILDCFTAEDLLRIGGG